LVSPIGPSYEKTTVCREHLGEIAVGRRGDLRSDPLRIGHARDLATRQGVDVTRVRAAARRTTPRHRVRRGRDLRTLGGNGRWFRFPESDLDPLLVEALDNPRPNEKSECANGDGE
jgi:hypothetical protein